MTVLITGLANPIGRYLLECATAQGINVRALAEPGQAGGDGRAELIRGTLADDAALDAAVCDVDVVYHNALIAQGTPQDLLRVNADGTRRLLEACGGAIRRFVLLSTPAVYCSHPTEDTWPVLADAPREAHGPASLLAYGQSMIAAEDYVLECHRLYGMEYCILRTTTTWGRNQYAAGIVRTLMNAPERAARIDAQLGPIQWLHGLDAARAALLAGSHDGARNQAFLVAASASVTSYGLLSELWEITRPTEENPFAAEAKARLRKTKLDVSKIRERLGFEPAISLRQSLEEVLGIGEPSPAPAEADMAGKTCVITGATAGLGLATAERLAALGARLVLVGRDPSRGAAALRQIRAAHPAVEASLFHADLARLGEVRRVASDILAAAPRIDVLINNAGAIFDRREITEDGLERTFALNYLAHFLLTRLLLDRLMASAPARVITIASIGHRGAQLDFDDLQNAKVAGGLDAYKRAKLCGILFTRELARRLSGTGVAAFSIDPGPVASRLGDDLHGPLGAWLSHAKQTMAMPPADAALGIVHLARSPAVIGASGGYFDQGRPATPAPAAQDDVAARRLWDASETLAALP